MSAIYKLSIQGIRSFDSNERETMEFGKPLTLIVGTNGSGKTTIIECLKYATTGDLPPNSKGGAFVHDPKITGEKDVRAQVKLAFTSANGVNMIVTRNIQLLVKKTTNTFKTLEGQLVAINQGERTTLSSRAAELDVQVPLYMGVPKAILDYVIFCHQEDSLWPLSEPANLKKRFDEIFQAMKFTKALDNLKTIRKDMSVDIKLLKQLVEHLKVDRDRSRAAKVNIRSLELKIEEYWDQFNEAGKRLDDITQQSDILFKSNQEFNQVLSKLDSLKHSRTSITEQIKRLQETVNPLDLPKHELISLLANFSSSLEEKRTLITEVQDDLKAKQKELETARDGYNHSISRQGELRAKQSAYNENMKIAKELRQQITTEENISGDDIVSQLKNIVDSRTGTLEKILSEHVREQSKLRTQLSELESSRVKEEQHLQYCDTDKEKLMKEIIELEEKLKQTSISQESLEQEKDILTNFQRRLESHRNESEADNVSLQIKDKNNKIVELENDLEKNQQLILKNNEQSDLHAKFSLIKKTFEGKKKELDNHFKELTADENANKWGFSETEDLDLIFKRFYIDLQKKIANETREFSDSNKEVTEEEFFVSQLTQEKATKAKEITKLTERITKILPEDCAIDDYAEVLEETENSYRTALENLKMHKTTLEFNLKALQVAETNNCCYLCQRKFDNKVEQSNLLKELKSRTDTKFEKTLKDIVDSESDYLSALRRAEKDIILQKDIMRSQIEIDKQIEEGKIRLGKKKENLSKIDRSSTALKKQLEYLENTLRPVIENLIRLKKEVRSLEVDHHATLDELSIYSQTNNEIQTMEELQTKQKQINDHLRKIRKEISELQEEKETKSNEFNKLINKVREKTFRINELERELAEKKNMENTLASRKSDTDNINSIISTATASLNVLKEKISSVNISLESISNQHSMEENKLKENLGKLTRQFEKLHDIELQIELYEQHDVLSLEKCITEIAEKKSSIEALAAEVDVLFKTLNEQTEQLRDSSNEQKNLKLNIDLLDLKTQLHEVDVKMGELDLKNAEAERDKYQQQSLHLRNSFEKLSAENAGRMGEIKQLQNQTESLKRQLDIDYKDIDVQYQKEWVKLQTKTLVTDDIDVYSKALDSAIMKYHSLKMQDINRIIDELWKRTYSGTDVDAIKIKSDEVSSSVRGKSYNYRVVMYKQDAELDMRGRCSAGQKVLASIIIRLALSETFGLNCGVIALDEPTTNLDEENIESLAKSLNNIIEFRRHQKNFQLIVITHDEKFLTHMNASDFADHFYKVKRDDRQKSQIEWVDINRVTE